MSSVARMLDFIDKNKIKKSEFYLKTGFSNGYLDKVKEIGSDKLEIILSKFSTINIEWLITGKGEMVKYGVPPIKGIPFYESEVIGGQQLAANMDAVSEPAEMIDPGYWFKDATGSMRVYGNSMETKYPSNSIIAFKEVYDKELIIYGREYVIETSEYRILKRIQKSTKKENVLACSYNEEKDIVGNVIHAPFEVPLKKITKLFEVLGKIER